MILEHEILKTLYIKVSSATTAFGSEAKGMTPIYKRIYGNSYLQFALLADLIYHPDKYLDKDKYGLLNPLNKQKRVREDVNILDEIWFDLSDAIENLILNGHATENLAGWDREISLTQKGALAFRNNYYIKEKELSDLEDIKGKISRLDLNQKRYAIFYDVLKVLIGIIIGALATWLPKLLDSLLTKQ